MAQLYGVAAVDGVLIQVINSYHDVLIRPSAMTEMSVPLFISDAQGSTSTSFQAHMRRSGGYWLATVELPDEDDEADWVLRCLEAGYNGIELALDFDEERLRDRDGRMPYRDVAACRPRCVYLSPFKAADACVAWWETDEHEVTYLMPTDVRDGLMDMYWGTGRVPEPNIAAVYHQSGPDRGKINPYIDPHQRLVGYANGTQPNDGEQPSSHEGDQ